MLVSKSTSILIATAVATLLSVGCSKKKSSDDEEESTTATSVGGGTGAGSTTITAAVPSSLALAIFPQSIDGTSLALADDEQVVDPNKLKSVREKVEENKERLSGQATECLNIAVFKPKMQAAALNCYEFDSGMNPFQISGETATRGTKTGLADTGTEACMVAFARNEVEETVERVDQAMELVSGMVCQAQKSGVAVDLTVGGSMDLAAPLAQATRGKMPIAAAKITRLADGADGSPVYHSRIEFTLPDGRTSSLNLVNSTGAAGSKGTLSFLRAGATPVQAAQTDPNNNANKADVMSISYSRITDESGNPRMRFEARFARMVKSITPFDEAGLVNYAALAQNANNSDVHAIKFVAFDMNPETNEGALSYWKNPGGNYNESARGFLFNIAKGSDGVLKGCGTSGATNQLSIRKAVLEPSDANVLSPVRDWQPRWALNVHADKDARFTAGETSVVTEQCFKSELPL